MAFSLGFFLTPIRSTLQRGAKVKVAGESVEGYHVFVGGGFGNKQAVGRQIFQGVSCDDLKPTLEKVLKGFLRHREPDETFQRFTRRHDLNSLQAIFSDSHFQNRNFV